jgi:calcineurin-like phosphoesterase family protein
MNKNIWFVSDTHFGHDNALKFASHDGKGRMREAFTEVEEMNQIMTERWNAHVKPEDIVYHLGDVLMGQKTRLGGTLAALNGRIRLVPGNHDNIELMVKIGMFDQIVQWAPFKQHGFICTHQPMLITGPEELRERTQIVNVHGHIHDQPDPSPHHMNICVERTEYRPLHLDEIIAEIKRRGL